MLHPLQYDREIPYGGHVYTCPLCSFVFVLWLRPYLRLILDAGAPNTAHSGGIVHAQV